jgi:putative ABC transport system permease protein
MSLRSKLNSLFRKEKLDAEMAEEMRLHLERRTQANLAAGMSADEARHAAQRQFGGTEQLKEIARDERGVRWLEHLVQDLRYASRALWKSPGFTLAATFTLALGIGLVTLQFSFINGALFGGLPFESSDRIMAITQLDARGKTRFPTVAQFHAWREQQQSFSGLGAHDRGGFELSGPGLDARSYRGGTFSVGVLELLRVRPLLGRGFVSDDERPGAPPVVLLGHHVWQNDFAADKEIVGRAVRLRGEPATIIGVLPPDFAFPQNESIWVNLRPGSGPNDDRPGMPHSVEVVGRLHDHTTLAVAQAEFDVLVHQSAAKNSAGDAATPYRARVRPFTEKGSNSKIAIALFSLLGVVGGVLAIACLNVANLFSARALHRSHEIALRTALGATRSRLVRQMLAESCLLAMLGAVGGVFLAKWAVPILNRGIAADPAKPFWIAVELDQRVLFATAGLTLVVGIMAGLFPALRATRANANEVLKDMTGGSASARLGRLNRWLVIAQVAVSSAVLLATSVLVDGVIRQSRVDVPFDPDQTLVADVRLPEREFPNHTARLNFQTALLERVRALPGVRMATISRGYPLQRSSNVAIDIMGREVPAGGEIPTVYQFNHAAPDFFQDTRISMREGRDFAETDDSRGERVAIVNERFARTFWPGGSALNQKIRRHAAPGTPDQPWLTIVGVTENLGIDPVTRNGGMVIHIPLKQNTSSQVTLLVTAAGNPRTLMRPVREIVRALSPDLPVENGHTFTEHFEVRGAPGRVFGALAGAFGASGLLLAAVGIYGVTSFTVQRRTREFGVRLAIGARPRDLLALVFKQGLRQLAIGLVVGTVAGWMLSQPLANLMARMSGGPPGLGAYLLVFSGVALALAFALWLPARRAAKVDPMVALRCE